MSLCRAHCWSRGVLQNMVCRSVIMKPRK